MKGEKTGSMLGICNPSMAVQRCLWLAASPPVCAVCKLHLVRDEAKSAS